MADYSYAADLFAYLIKERKWWMIPLVAVLIIFGALLVLVGSSPLAPFLYPLF